MPRHGAYQTSSTSRQQRSDWVGFGGKIWWQTGERKVGYIFSRQHCDLLVYIPCGDGFASGDMPIHTHECVSDTPRSGGDAPAKKLKMPMENAMATDEPTRARGLEMFWCHPRGRSKNGERAVIDGKGIGGAVKSRVEGPLKKPSHLTATTGATEYVDVFFSSMTNCVVHDQPWYYIHGAQLQKSLLRGQESFRFQNRIRTSWKSNLAP